MYTFLSVHIFISLLVTGIRNKGNIFNESKLTDFSNINSLNININSFKELTMMRDFSYSY